MMQTKGKNSRTFFLNVYRHIPLDVGSFFSVLFTLVPSWILHRFTSGWKHKRTKQTFAYLFLYLFYSSTIPVEIWHQTKSYKRLDANTNEPENIAYLCVFFQCILLHNFILVEFHIGHSDRLAQFLKDFLANRNESKILVYLIASNL